MVPKVPKVLKFLEMLRTLRCWDAENSEVQLIPPHIFSVGFRPGDCGGQVIKHSTPLLK